MRANRGSRTSRRTKEAPGRAWFSKTAEVSQHLAPSPHPTVSQCGSQGLHRRCLRLDFRPGFFMRRLELHSPKSAPPTFPNSFQLSPAGTIRLSATREPSIFKEHLPQKSETTIYLKVLPYTALRYILRNAVYGNNDTKRGTAWAK